MKRLSSLLLLAPFIAGCVPAPPTTQSEKPLAPTSLGLASDLAPSIAEQWWSEFGDPQLDRLVGEALAGSPTLAAARPGSARRRRRSRARARSSIRR